LNLQVETSNLHKSRKLLQFGLVATFIFIAVLIIGIVITQFNKPKTKSRNEIVLELPHITADYSIVYSDNKDQIYINVINPPYDENRKKAVDWLLSQGADLNSLKIKYLP